VIATGHLNHEQSLQVGDRIQIGGQARIVHTVEPLLGEHEVPLVVQLLAHRG
jgi:pSer/pThr/pTyr-binding forkhead associated (FHA) protein